MERFNAMGKEFCINDEVMCRDDEDGVFVQWEDAQGEIERLTKLIPREVVAIEEARPYGKFLYRCECQNNVEWWHSYCYKCGSKLIFK